MKSKLKTQNSKEIQRKRFVDLKWVVYFRSTVLGLAEKVEKGNNLWIIRPDKYC